MDACSDRPTSDARAPHTIATAANQAPSPLVHDNRNFSVLLWNAKICERVYIARHQGKHWVWIIKIVVSDYQIENNFVFGIGIGGEVSTGIVSARIVTGYWQFIGSKHRGAQE